MNLPIENLDEIIIKVPIRAQMKTELGASFYPDTDKVKLVDMVVLTSAAAFVLFLIWATVLVSV